MKFYLFIYLYLPLPNEKKPKETTIRSGTLKTGQMNRWMNNLTLPVVYKMYASMRWNLLDNV